MASPQIESGEVMDVSPLGEALAGAKTMVLLKSPRLSAVRLVVPAGTCVPEHTAPGDITVHCLEGEVDFSAVGRVQRLRAGQLLYLSVGSPHSLLGVEDASLLVTIARA